MNIEDDQIVKLLWEAAGYFNALKDLIKIAAETKEAITKTKKALKLAMETAKDSLPEAIIKDLVREIYWDYMFVPATTVESLVPKGRSIAQFAGPISIEVRCIDCKAKVKCIVKTRTQWKNKTKSGTVCDSCEAEREARWAKAAQRRKEQEKADNERLDELRAMPYQEYLESPEWKATRKKALKRAWFKCELCNGKDNLSVHHKTYDHLGEEWTDDLIVLCEEDHKKFHDIA